jgi:hypothetical protein
MRCETARLALGEAMDERQSPRAEAETHRRGCPSCTSFARRAWRVREVSRFEVAPPVPDLVPAIMARIEQEARRRRSAWPVPTQPHAPRRRRAPRTVFERRAAVAGLAAGLITGFLLSAGGIVPTERINTAALADEIPGHLVQAAVTLEGYRATFDITELHWTGDVPVRTFVANLAFLAPEGFRAQVSDTTDYPSDEWPRNDLLLVTDGRSWRASGPDPCPQAALPACPRSSRSDRSVTNRAPFDSQTPMPTDVIVPMTVLAASSRVEVSASGRVAGREAVAVELDYQDASPLFDYLRFLGSWRPFFPRDRVVVWLDGRTWFPLRYQVFPAPGAERATWAGQVGLPPEGPAAPVFNAEVRAVSTAPPSADLFASRPGPRASDQGFLDSPTEDPEDPAAGTRAPRRTAGLTLWRAGRFERTPSRPFDMSILAYTRGLTWLTVTEVQGWSQRHLFGVGPFAQQVALGTERAVGYYEPATATEARRVAVHTADGEFLVASNLPRATLLSVAASLPVAGEARPAGWSIHRWSNAVVEEGLTPNDAIPRMSFQVLVPSILPSGYRAASATIVRTPATDGITIVYRRPAAELGGAGMLLYQSTGETLPPPTGDDEQMVQVAGTTGRWSPESHVLDWIDPHGVYRSLAGASFDLTTLLKVAASLVPAGDRIP